MPGWQLILQANQDWAVISTFLNKLQKPGRTLFEETSMVKTGLLAAAISERVGRYL
jgi:hypothetical protein